MNDQEFFFLQKLVESPSPSGFEQPAQRVLRSELEPFVDELKTDIVGNLIARIEGQGPDPMRVMLAAHCDEIGFMIHHIDEQGFLSFSSIGGVDAHLVPGQRVRIQGAKGPVLGVVGKKPIHQIEPGDRDKVVKIKEQFIDIGCESAEEATSHVAVGDAVTFAVGMERLLGDRVASRAMDDKVGAFIMAQVMKAVRERGGARSHLFGVSTVQEEIGLRGGTTSAYDIRPDVGIVVEVGFATDYPGMNPKDIGEFKLGGGPIIARGANINPALFELLVDTARQHRIPVQILAAPRATGTDANPIQLNRGGVAAALVKVPLRYMHTPVETLSLSDVESCIRLLTEVVLRLESRQQLIPV